MEYSPGMEETIMEEYTRPRSIIQDATVKPYRAPGAKRQRVMLFVTVAVVAGIAAAAYLFLVPKDKPYVLRTYNLASVSRANLVRKTQVSGTVGITVSMTVTAPDLGKTGYVAELYVREGDTVVKGQRLARLQAPDLEDELTDLEAELDEARAALEQLEVQNLFSRNRAEREISRLQGEIGKAEAEVERQRRLVALNTARASDLEAAEESLAKLEADLDEKRIELDESKTLAALNEAARAAQIGRLETRIHRLEADIESATVTSPLSGEVLETAGILSVPGSAVSSGEKLFTIADRSSAIVDLEVPEQYAGLLEEGVHVALSIGGTAMSGAIASVGKVATISSDGLGATVTVKVVPEAPDRILPGSSVVAEIVLGVKQDALTLPRGPYLSTGSQRYVYVVNGNEAVRRNVTFGEIQTDTVEILSGLEEGDTVITSGYQNYIEYETITLGGTR